jgi:hypothetical protein
MDPLSLTLGVGGLLPVLAKVIEIARLYYVSAKDSTKMIANLISHLELLQRAICDLKEYIDHKLYRSAGDWSKGLDHSSALLCCASICETRLRQLQVKLEPPKNRGTFARLSWPLRHAEVQKAVDELRVFAELMQFALTVNGAQLLSSALNGVKTILSHQFEHLQLSREIQDTLERIEQSCANHDAQRERDGQDDLRRRIADWICAEDSEQKHRTMQSIRVPDTGTWLLENEAFRRWEAREGSSNVFWCHGHPGSGKTVLTFVCTCIGICTATRVHCLR